MENKIDITGVDLRTFVKEVYNISSPQGLGCLHFKQGELTDSEADELLSSGNYRLRLNLDYVRGRACKMTVYIDGDRLLIPGEWYDHSPEQLAELLKRVGKSPVPA